MRYSNHEYSCPNSIQIVLVFVGFCLLVMGAFFGNYYLAKSDEANTVYRNALADRTTVDSRLIESKDELAEGSTQTNQSLVNEKQQLNEIAQDSVDQRNRFGSFAKRFSLMALFGASILLVPTLFGIARIIKPLLSK